MQVNIMMVGISRARNLPVINCGQQESDLPGCRPPPDGSGAPAPQHRWLAISGLEGRHHGRSL